eukprot:6422646-Pyramimonas_sp.AAC.1
MPFAGAMSSLRHGQGFPWAWVPHRRAQALQTEDAVNPGRQSPLPTRHRSLLPTRRIGDRTIGACAAERYGEED